MIHGSGYRENRYKIQLQRDRYMGFWRIYNTGKENTDLIVRFIVHIFFHFWTSPKGLAVLNSLTRNSFRVWRFICYAFYSSYNTCAFEYLYEIKLFARSYIIDWILTIAYQTYIIDWILTIAYQTAGPNGLNFIKETFRDARGGGNID